jgi:hypothetical protein
MHCWSIDKDLLQHFRGLSCTYHHHYFLVKQRQDDAILRKFICSMTLPPGAIDAMIFEVWARRMREVAEHIKHFVPRNHCGRLFKSITWIPSGFNDWNISYVWSSDSEESSDTDSDDVFFHRCSNERSSLCMMRLAGKKYLTSVTSSSHGQAHRTRPSLFRSTDLSCVQLVLCQTREPEGQAEGSETAHRKDQGPRA